MHSAAPAPLMGQLLFTYECNETYVFLFDSITNNNLDCTIQCVYIMCDQVTVTTRQLFVRYLLLIVVQTGKRPACEK